MRGQSPFPAMATSFYGEALPTGGASPKKENGIRCNRPLLPFAKLVGGQLRSLNLFSAGHADAKALPLLLVLDAKRIFQKENM